MTAQDAADILGRLEAAADRFETAMPAGKLVWHLWGEGPPLVLLHGGAGSWRHWTRNIEELATRFRLVVPDLPGLGESGSPPEPADAQSVAMLLADGLDAVLGPGLSFGLAGFSFGGVVGAEMALLRPAQVTAFAVLGSNSLGLPVSSGLELVRVRHLSGAERRAAHVANLARGMIADPERIDNLAITIQEWNVSHARLNTPAISRQNSLRRALDHLRLPLAVIYGNRDSVAYPYIQERVDLFHEVQPNASVHLVAGAGHWAPYEAAEEINRIILGFFEMRSCRLTPN